MVISVRNLNVRYRNIHALSDISVDIEENEIFGIIGPNGAGKTTMLECIEGLRNHYSGSISVLGMDPRSDRSRLYRHIGVQLQETVYQDRIKVFELGKLFQSFYDDPADFDGLLEEFGLIDKRKAYVGKLSGGQRQRLSIILALTGRPKIIFLDEITTGLDPMARRDIWQIVRNLKNKGMTIVLTTHYMDEAEELCDRIAVINKGKLAAVGTLDELSVKASGGRAGFSAATIGNKADFSADAVVGDRIGNRRDSRLEDVFFALTGEGFYEQPDINSKEIIRKWRK